MEIDNLKEFWNKDQEALPEVPLEKQDEIFSPLEMIRINMKTEFWLLIITLPSLLYGFPFDNTNVNITRIAAFEVFLTIGFMTYFYTRFIKLYRMLRTTGINTNYDLFNMKTQLLVSKEIYISYYISYIPLAFLISLINVNFHLDNVYYITVFGFSFLLSVLVVFIMIRFWIHYMYGRHISELVSVIDELNGIAVQSYASEKKSWFERSQLYLKSKFGLKGHILNTILWFISSYILLTVALCLVIVIAVVIGIKLDYIDKHLLLKVLE
ncbi:hypothetical protein OMO38_00425 [Chryseobacterium sp. 09-1422]|jgi:hypothetical protein|uniref:Beta-carotene 15,15'-monooxygenase n=1 Tax=Chryseobacterium kimseyorum TaxID=2984028 RepID=A0ABT3HT63_9FLAO|nr:hypothetical protein [Chryseobacterium kimseyorum]MCW3166978.1 hypothetical protein [Chryseobacterium kimseyorum]